MATLSSFLFGYHLGLVLTLHFFSLSQLFYVEAWKKKIPLFFITLALSRVVNEPLESISKDLGFKGNTLAEGCMKLIFCFILSSIVISDFCIQLYLLMGLIIYIKWRSGSEYMFRRCVCWIIIQWMGSWWSWTSEGFSTLRVAYDYRCCYEVIYLLWKATVSQDYHFD